MEGIKNRNLRYSRILSYKTLDIVNAENLIILKEMDRNGILEQVNLKRIFKIYIPSREDWEANTDITEKEFTIFIALTKSGCIT